MTVTVSAEYFECPDCEESFGEEALMELCGEPFNGTIVECKKCHKEFSCDIIIRIEEVG
jgi:uncharacterized CHY-type Zn-finger protein